MNEAARLIAELPASTPISVTVGSGSMTAEDLRRAFIATQGKRILTTGEASDLFGYSQSMWAKWAAADEIEGAYQDADGGPWRLPYASCEAHVARRRERAQTNGGRRGKPWGTPESVPSQGLTVVEGGPSSVGRVQDGHAGPDGPGMAGERSADRLRGAR